MASERVPYIPYGQRLFQQWAILVWAVMALIAVRIAFGPDLVFLFATLILAGLSFNLAANWWAVRHGCELVSRDEREQRLAAENAAAPLWHSALWQAVMLGMFVPLMLALSRDESPYLDRYDHVRIAVEVAALMFPFVLVIGFVMANGTRRRARKQVAKALQGEALLGNRVPLQRAVLLGLWTGVALAIVILGLRYVWDPEASSLDLVQTSIGVVAAMVAMGVNFWAGQQARDWTPR